MPQEVAKIPYNFQTNEELLSSLSPNLTCLTQRLVVF